MGNISLTSALSTDNKITIDSDGNFGFDGNLFQKILSKTANYTYQPDDGVLLMDTTSGDLEVTLPAITAWPDQAYRNIIPIVHVAGGNNLKVKLSGAEEFAWGNTFFNLGKHLAGFNFAAIRNGSMTKYGLLSNLVLRASAHREASWAASNFSATTIIPWDAEPYNTQDEFFVYTSGASARYTILTTGTYALNYTIDIDSTGGATWNATSQVYVNGVAIENTEVRTGNYGGEDQSLSLPCTYVDIAAGEYIDLRIDQNNLTGNLVHSMFNIKLEL